MRESRRRRYWLLALALVALAVALTAAGCGGDDSGGGGSTQGFTDAGYAKAGFKTVEIPSGQPIKIGISSALSGDVKGLGEPIANSAKAAGQGVQVKGYAIEFVAEDDLCSAEGGPAAADRLIKANVIAVVGPICSGGTRPSLARYEAAGITQISPSATAGDLTTPARAEGPYVTFFRTPVLNADEARVQAEYVTKTLKVKTAFVVNDTDDYGKDLAAQFQKYFKQQGGTIVGSPEGYGKKQTDFKSVIANIKQAKPDLVYLAGFYGEATPFIQQLRQDPDLKNVKFMGSDGVKNDEFIAGAKAAAEGAYLALPGTTGSQFSTYAKKYAQLTGGKESDAESATFGAEAYDAATAIIKALDKVAKDSGGKLSIDLKALNTEIKNSNFEGASGAVKFGNNGDRSGAVVRIFRVEGGKYVEQK